ncbi:MAG: NAD(P)-dependent oxidoreductase [Candidatus Omnitrophica bacterium]|nr:NAD(P)-dependent oxidoreductase [Candidatus Omnitrophota bacterium]
MRILVTGATGFIGNRLVGRLEKKGHDIVCLVRRESNTSGLEKRGLRLAVGDITDFERVEKIFQDERPECVFHCAARVKDAETENIYRTNIEGTRNICESCYRNGAGRLVYLSSVAVVSGNPEVPLVEDLPYKTTSVYGRSKVEAEKITLDYRQKGLGVAILRPCMVYGEGEPHALSRILGLVNKRFIPVPGLKRIRDRLCLAYVDNVTYALELAMENKEAVKGTFFIADKDIITIREFLTIVSDELDISPPFVIPGWIVNAGLLVPPLRNRFNRVFKDRVYDIRRATDLLGYDPEVSTAEGLRRTVRYWKRGHKAESSGV